VGAVRYSVRLAASTSRDAWIFREITAAGFKMLPSLSQAATLFPNDCILDSSASRLAIANVVGVTGKSYFCGALLAVCHTSGRHPFCAQRELADARRLAKGYHTVFSRFCFS